LQRNELSINTLGGQYNGYYGGEDNNVSEGMRFNFNGIDNYNLNNDIVVAALQQSGNTYLIKNCKAFSIGPNFQINVGRKRTLDNQSGLKTEDSVINVVWNIIIQGKFIVLKLRIILRIINAINQVSFFNAQMIEKNFVLIYIGSLESIYIMIKI
jgi:hypothetical protein